MAVGRRKLRIWWPLALVTGIAALITWLLYTVWKSPRSADLVTFGAFALPVMALVASWVTWAWRRAKADPAAAALDGEKLDRTADQLALAVQSQWEKAAVERGLAGTDSIQVTWGGPSAPMTGPLAAAVSARQFDPLPGLSLAEEPHLVTGQLNDMHAVYGGLGSGRLVIAGSPGAGKSGAAVLLTLAAVRYRERAPASDKPKVPVPVLVTAQDWDPRRQSVADWLTIRLQETYPMFAGVTGAAIAGALISTGRIALIIDGLDELSVSLRPVALQALSQQGSFRIVVLSRTAEMAAAASDGGVLRGAAAIELRSISSTETASYLERLQLDPPPDGWRDLIDHIRNCPDTPLSKALNNPLALTLVRDTYQSGDNARELLEFASNIGQAPAGENITEVITDHLLDRLLPAIYMQRPGQPALRYDLQTAQAALVKIAAQLSSEGTTDLLWWHINTWPSRSQRVISWGLTFGLISVLLEISEGILYAILSMLGWGIAGGISAWLTDSRNRSRKGILRSLTRRPAGWRRRIIWCAIWIVLTISSAWIIIMIIWLVAGLANALTADFNVDGSLSPATSRRNNRNRGLVFALAFWLGGGILGGLIAVLAKGFTVANSFIGIISGLLLGLVIGIIAGFASSRAWRAPFTEVQLAIIWRTPVRLMSFLDDAHDRNVLRTIGPAYQFRHARLQDRLAAAAIRQDSISGVRSPS